MSLNKQADKYELVNCNLCGSKRFNEVCILGGNTTIVKCKDCGLIYRNPRLKEDVNREYYNVNYYRVRKGKEEVVSKARFYLFKKLLTSIEKKTKSGSRTMLDIGCGYGHFLKLAADSGWQVKGIELAGSACKYAKEQFGIDIENKDLKEANFEKDCFGVVTLWNVLDHFLDPFDALIEIHRILKPGGILVIRVPNVDFHLFVHRFFSLILSIIKSDKWNDPAVITNYGFSKKSMRRILEEANFRHIRVYNSPLSSGDPYGSFGKYGSKFANFIKNIYNIFSGVVFYLSFKRLNIGSSLLIYARKEEV